MVTQTITLKNLLKDTINIMKARGNRIFGVIFAVLIGLGLLFTAVYLIQYGLISTGIINNNNIPLYQLIAYLIGILLFLVIAAFVQILMVTVFIFPTRSMLEDIQKSKEYLPRFVLLTIFISLLFLLANAPFYGALPLIYFDVAILGVVSIVVGFLLNILVAVFFFSAPFLIVEKNLSTLHAMKESIKLVAGRSGSVALMLIILAAILVILQIIAYIGLLVPYAGQFINLLLTIIMIILSTSFVFALYKKLA